MKKNIPRKIGKYLIDLSIVVAGIAITFSVNNLINSCNEKKDMHLYLNAVKIELEENLRQVKMYRRFYEENAKLNLYLQSVEFDEVNPDSLASYDSVITQIVNINFKTGAYDMFMTSGVMRLIQNKDFVVSIMDSYSQLEASSRANENYMIRKWDQLDEAFGKVEGRNLDMEEIIPKNRKLYNFLSTRINMEQRFAETEEVIEKTLEYMQ